MINFQAGGLLRPELRGGQKMDHGFLWPGQGGTWRERLLAMALGLELLLIWGGFYLLAWRLTR